MSRIIIKCHWKILFTIIIMEVVGAKEAKVVVNVNDLHQGLRDVAFEGKVLCWYETFNWIVCNAMRDLDYAYLYCDLLDKGGLTTVTMQIKTPFIEEQGEVLQRRVYVKVENFRMQDKLQKLF